MTDERGFSLVELLVAMVASSLLLLALGGVAAGLAARVRAPDRSDTALADARSSAALAALVERAVPSDRLTAVIADAQSLVFPIRGQSGEALTVALQVSADGTRLEAELLDDRGAALAGTGEAIIEDAQSIRIDAPIVETSNGDRRLASVTVIVTRSDGSEQVLAATPRITARPGCRFDPISLSCRAQ